MKQFIQKTTRISLRLFLLAALLAGVLAASGTPTIASASGPAIVIDDFNTGAFSLTDNSSGGGVAINNLTASGAIGGTRDVIVDDSGTFPPTPSVMTLTPGDGYLNLAVGNLPGNYQVGWGTLIFSGAELNLNASGHDRVVVTLSQAPSSGVITVIIHEPTTLFISDSSLSLSGAGDYTFLFSSFHGIDFSDLDGIKIVFDQGVSASSTIRVESIVIGSAPCPAGQYDNGSGCVDADPGYYVPVSGATEQTPCALGTYQPNAGSVSCNPASPGHYVDVTAAAMQIDCLPASYQPNAGATSCFAADPGYFVSTTGAIISTPCAAGSYQPNTGSTSCLLADPGYYVPVSGAIAQLGCPAGTTSTAGAMACTLVLYNWSGFFQPVDNLPALNQVKAGQGIPVKFSLSGNQGLNILASASPASVQIACDGSAPVDTIETVTAGNSGLSYDAANDTYTYVWKTNKSWAGTCRQLQVTLTDGTVHMANFKFK